MESITGKTCQILEIVFFLRSIRKHDRDIKK